MSSTGSPKAVGAERRPSPAAEGPLTLSGDDEVARKPAGGPRNLGVRLLLRPGSSPRGRCPRPPCRALVLSAYASCRHPARPGLESVTLESDTLPTSSAAAASVGVIAPGADWPSASAAYPDLRPGWRAARTAGQGVHRRLCCATHRGPALRISTRRSDRRRGGHTCPVARQAAPGYLALPQAFVDDLPAAVEKRLVTSSRRDSRPSKYASKVSRKPRRLDDRRQRADVGMATFPVGM